MPLARPIRELAVAPPDVGSLAAFLPYLDFPLDVLQSPPALQRAARELVEDWHRDGVAYGEASFAPQLHTRAGMSVDDAIRASPPACATAQRHRRGDRADRVLPAPPTPRRQPGRRRRGRPLRGRDSSPPPGSQARGRRDRPRRRRAYPGSTHREAFDLAHAAGIPVTVHAGEAAGPASVWEAVEVLGARRIGHGVRSVTTRRWCAGSTATASPSRCVPPATS